MLDVAVLLRATLVILLGCLPLLERQPPTLNASGIYPKYPRR